MKATLARRFTFRAAHHCWNPDWTPEQNRKAFGRCATPGSHGHTYILEPILAGSIDPVTGMIVNVADLKVWASSVLRDFDYRDLNADVEEFREIPPTLENIAQVLFRRLATLLPSGVTLDRLRLYEDDAVFVECSG
jgi:6-pyruvoyltetrahydropterin/6-carboxytetrahydropterin synthase